MSFTVRRLTKDDADAYRAIRLRALKELPSAFLDSHEEAIERSDDYWTSLFDRDHGNFGAFANGELIGIAGYYCLDKVKVAHKSWLYGMYVGEDARGTGCALALIEAIEKAARQDGAIQMHLGVSANNDPARRLYGKAGFTAYGTEPRGIRIGDSYFDEIFMVKFFDDGRPQ